MTTITLNPITRTYKNNGQHLEQTFRYNLTGKIEKADNLKATDGCDLFNYSIKSARATICKGTDLDKHLATDKATEFVYITESLVAYIMNKTEYKTFVSLFSTVDTESAKNGGATKLRLKRETTTMLEWLARQ
jgi:hypothetical protein